MMIRILTLSISLAACLFLTGCGNDQTGDGEPQCESGLTYDPIQGECVRLSDGPIDEGPVTGTPDAGGEPQDQDDAGIDSPDAPPDATDDAGTDPDLGCVTDLDNDGVLAMSCGGTDCDDDDFRAKPDAIELCDDVDNNCDGAINEALDCSFYAHSLTQLYRLDIFAGTSQDLGPVPDLNDIDTHPDGTLYGIDYEYLYSYDAATQQWNQAAQQLSFFELANGFCIDNLGTAYITTGSTLRVVNLATGASSSRGSMFPASSSGDCVVNKGNVLFMTSSHTTPDSIVKLDGATGQSTQVGVTGHDAIWGLTAAWGRVYGMTDQGDVVEIDVTTGQTTPIHTYAGISFYGAASTPAR